MRNYLWPLIVGILLTAGWVRADTVTLRFSQPFVGGIASGFSSRNGSSGMDGLKWGIIIDTAGDGFARNGTAYYPMGEGLSAPAFMKVTENDLTDDYFIPASELTANFSVLTEGGGTVTGGTGTIDQIAAIPLNINDIDTGDSFAIIWFDGNTAEDGDAYGFLTDPSFTLPIAGATSNYDALFVGPDPVRNASYQFTLMLPQKIAVYDGDAIAPGNERTNNIGVFAMGTVPAGTSGSSQTFTIRNKGSGNLTGISISKAASGKPDDFLLNTTSTQETLLPGETTTFKVTYSPRIGGNSSAVIQIFSNDEVNNPFNIQLQGVSQGLALNSGLLIGHDDPADTLSLPAGTAVRYAVTVAASAATSNQVVVWIPVPTSSDPNFLLGAPVISNGGVYTESELAVAGAEIPANSVYWNLGDIAPQAPPQRLSLAVTIHPDAPDGTTYKTTVFAHTTTQGTLLDRELTLTVGPQNLPPENGSVVVTKSIFQNKTRVTVSFTDWTDPENNLPLSYGIRNIESGENEIVVIPDGAESTISFILPTNPTSFVYRARIKDSFGHVTTRTFQIQSPEITVEDPSGNGLTNNDAFSFGTVPFTGEKRLTFTIKNTGTDTLSGLAATLDQLLLTIPPFSITSSPASTLAPGESTSLTVRFYSSRTIHKARLLITSNDVDESPFTLNLEGLPDPAPSHPPAVITQPATTITASSAILTGTIDTKGEARDVRFEYGQTTALAQSIVATPATVSGENIDVEAPLTGLEAHTTYYYRVTAASLSGSASGKIRHFVTANRSPLPVDDSFGVILGTKTPLPVLANDSDPDGDALKISSFTALSDPKAGKLTKSGNQLYFTPSDTFAENVTFSYTVSDGFDGKATATVTLSPADPFNITPTTHSVTSVGGSYEVAIDDLSPSNSGVWVTSSKVSWIKISASSGSGDGTVTVIYQPNPSINERQGTILIAGQSHTIIQAGVTPPELQVPAPIPPVVVGNPYSLTIPTKGAPVTYKISKLPAGLKIDHATGIISGIPTKAGLSKVTVSAKNAQGSSNEITFDLNVQDIRPGLVGTFHGFAYRNSDINAQLGSRFELVTTRLGTFTGKLVSGGSAQSFKGRLTLNPNDPDHASLTLNIARKNLSSLTLNINLDAAKNSLRGAIDDNIGHTTQLSAWRNAWDATHSSSTYAVPHSFALITPESEADVAPFPRGYGFGTFTVHATKGTLKVIGKLPDGSAFTTATFLGQDGQILMYQALYTGKQGSLAGYAFLDANNKLSLSEEGTVTWLKPAPANVATSKDTIYKTGFGPLDLNLYGEAYVTPTNGELVMGLEPAVSPKHNAHLVFTEGSLEADEFGIEFDLINPNSRGLTNKAIIPINPQTVLLPTINPKTGSFSGSFAIPATAPAATRKVTFYGQIVGAQGYGFFLLPESPDEAGEKLSTTPKHSGRVILEKAAP